MRADSRLSVLILAVVCFLLNACAALDQTSRSSPQFAFLTSSSDRESKPAFRVRAELPLGTQVRLLENNASDSCLAEARAHGREGGFPGLVYTELEPLDCRAPEDYSIALPGGGLTSYEVVRGKEIKDGRVSDILDEKVRGSSVLASLERKAQQKKLTEGEWSLYDVKPRVLKIHFPGTEVLVAVYDLHESAGPRAFFFKNAVYPFTGWCSLPVIRAFLLNGTPYFESGSKCCDCATTIREIFRVGEQGVELIHAETIQNR